MSKLMSLLREIDRYLLIAIATACLLLCATIIVLEPIVGWPASLREHIPEIALFLLASFIAYYMRREQVLRDYAKWKELGIKGVYRSRSDPDQGEAYLRMMKTARTEIFVVGITLKDLARENGGLLLQKAKSGLSIKLLMLSPEYWKNDNPILDPIAAAAMTNLRPDFQIAIAHIRALAMEMARVHAKFEVKFYRQAPTLSLTMIDGASSRAKMRVELTPHNRLDEKFRPMLDLRQSGGKDLLTQFYSSYLALWATATGYLEVQGSKIKPALELDAQVSKMLDLGADWLPEELKVTDLKVLKAGG